ncbi:MAG: phosphomannomutase/phosphoglucomutase [Candidatus Aquiluna sp. XM-24bin5]|nr:MAG: phosphomannomutase/phosphoglucomutase [Candidatus Aquiluna sp. XM-24bin5]
MDFDNFVKTYDVRGLVRDELTPELIQCFGAGFVDELELAGKSLVVGHDMRDSSPEFAAAFAQGAMKRGASVVEIGLCSTDMTYFASGRLDLPAAMFTASHNPATYNGIKFSRAGARGISLDTGLAGIRDRAKNFFEKGIAAVSSPGSSHELSVLDDYSDYLHSLVDLAGVRKLKVVVDVANGMGGLTVPAVLSRVDQLEIVPMYFELDGTFPNHEANPLDEKNLVDLQKRVIAEGADIGLAFDGDADRCFAVDEKGMAVSPSAVAAIVSRREVQRVSRLGEKDIVVIHNALTSSFVAETIEQAGATPHRTKVGHSLIKDQMAATGAVFGGEHSAHYYFRDFWGADNGMLAAMHLISELGNSHVSTSELARANTPYFSSGEINSRVDDKQAALERVRNALEFNSEEKFDGTTFHGESDGGWWWCNIRPSNTEPLLRLNVESNHEALMIEIRDKAISQIRNT